VTKEGWRDLYLWPRFKQGWRFWVVAWLGTPLLILLGAGLFFALFPQYLDPTLSTAQTLLDQAAKSTGRAMPYGPLVFIVLQTVQAIITAPLVVGPATFGEEFGWRAYLLPKLMPLGGRKAAVLLGVVWGVWHWPIIAMGYNYGFDYPGAPWAGMLAMVWFAFVVGTFLIWLTLKAKSVWPAVIGHAVLNGFGAIGALVVQGQPDPGGADRFTAFCPAGNVAAVAFAGVHRSPDVSGFKAGILGEISKEQISQRLSCLNNTCL
jgi:membrane protease YdiL (CAAX protease family)